MQFCKIESINGKLEKNPSKLVADVEMRYREKLSRACDWLLAGCDERPVVLISGPSGSGKTTTALRIEQLLDIAGHETHTISMDNYFLPNKPGELPTDEFGNVDLESPQRLDIELLENHLNKLFRCEPVEVPIFDFISQSRTGRNPLRRKKGELIILEGIHALNPMVTGETAAFSKGIYISVRTRVADSQGHVLHPANIRLMRRLIRDKLFRGRRLTETMAHFQSVSRGEELYIMPHKHRAGLELDTFFPYELSAYRDALLPDLTSLGKPFLQEHGYEEMAVFLEEARPMELSLIPENALVREFIGGGVF